MSKRLSSRATATLDYEHTAPEAAQADPTSALALGTHIGSQSGHHKTHLNQRTLGQCKGYGSKPYISGPKPMWTKQQKVGSHS